MGVTIHYEGKASSAERVGDILAVAAAYATEQGWAASARNHGVVLVPHDLCEPLELSFSDVALVPSWVKTQFAGPDVHVAVVGLFRRLAPSFRELHVEDDAQFWESGDLEGMKDAFDQVEEGLAAALQEPDSSGPYRLPSGRPSCATPRRTTHCPPRPGPLRSSMAWRWARQW